MSEPLKVTIENARLLFRNFSGNEGQYNAAGEREFTVLIDHENAERMIQDGWNIKYLKPREEGDEPQPYLTIKVSFKNRPPTIVMIAGTKRTRITEDSVETLDWAEIDNADLVVVQYQWTVGGKTGIKAYLKSLYVTVAQDDLDRKYALDDEEG